MYWLRTFSMIVYSIERSTPRHYCLFCLFSNNIPLRICAGKLYTVTACWYCSTYKDRSQDIKPCNWKPLSTLHFFFDWSRRQRCTVFRRIDLLRFKPNIVQSTESNRLPQNRCAVQQPAAPKLLSSPREAILLYWSAAASAVVACPKPNGLRLLSSYWIR